MLRFFNVNLIDCQYQNHYLKTWSVILKYSSFMNISEAWSCTFCFRWPWQPCHQRQFPFLLKIKHLSLQVRDCILYFNSNHNIYPSTINENIIFCGLNLTIVSWESKKVIEKHINIEIHGTPKYYYGSPSQWFHF